MNGTNYKRILIYAVFSVLIFSWLDGAIQQFRISEVSESERSVFALKESMPLPQKVAAFGHLGGTLVCFCITLAYSRWFLRISPLRFIGFLVMIGWSLWLAVDYHGAEFFSTKLYTDGPGPFVWLSCSLCFAGMLLGDDPTLRKVLLGLCILSGACLFLNLLTLESFSRVSVQRNVLIFQKMLFWTLPFTYFAFRDHRLLSKVLLGLCFLYILSSIASQTRSFVLLGCLSLIYFIYQGRPLIIRTASFLLLGAPILWFATITVMAFSPDFTNEVIQGFQSRLTQDTRTSQYEVFFKQVPAENLIFGQGLGASYHIGYNRSYRYIDNGAIWILWIGGIPLLATYFGVLFPPRFSFFANPSYKLTAGLWMVSLLGVSTYTSPSAKFEHYIVCLVAGIGASEVIKRHPISI